MTDWIPYNKPWLEFKREGLSKVGILLEVLDTEGQKETLLIGDINDLGGLCNDCSVRDEMPILRYRVVWERKSE